MHVKEFQVTLCTWRGGEFLICHPSFLLNSSVRPGLHSSFPNTCHVFTIGTVTLTQSCSLLFSLSVYQAFQMLRSYVKP